MDVRQMPLKAPKFTKILGWRHVKDCFSLFRVDVNTLCGDDEIQEFAAGNPQERLSRLHLQLMCEHKIEYCFQVIQMVTFPPTFDGNVINITFYRVSKVFAEYSAHSLLVRYPSILQIERHYCITVNPFWRPE